MSAHLVETCVNGIIAMLKAGLPTALTEIRTDHGDSLVTMEPPRDYFIYPHAQAYRAPAVFVIGDRIDFRKAQLGANHVNADVRVNATCVVEDKDSTRIMIKSYRYQAAIYQVLDQKQFMSSDNDAKVTLIVEAANFSPLYSTMDNPNDPRSVFRREISLDISCILFEPFS